jgi:hypothetical protein
MPEENNEGGLPLEDLPEVPIDENEGTIESKTVYVPDSSVRDQLTVWGADILTPDTLSFKRLEELRQQLNLPSELTFRMGNIKQMILSTFDGENFTLTIKGHAKDRSSTVHFGKSMTSDYKDIHTDFVIDRATG